MKSQAVPERTSHAGIGAGDGYFAPDLEEALPGPRRRRSAIHAEQVI
jgi:hypothetical protein